MKAFFKQSISPQIPEFQHELQYWRERIMKFLLLASTILVSIVYGISLYQAIQSKAWTPIIIYTVIYLVFLIITFSKRSPYPLRAMIVLGFFYAFGVISAIQSGVSGFTGLWFLLFSLAIAILINAWLGLVGVALGVFSFFFVYFGLQAGWFGDPITSPGALTTWIQMAILFFVISSSAVILFGLLIRGIEKSLETRDQVRAELLQEREMFERRNRDIQRRESQVKTAAEISRAISAQLNQEQLFNQVVELVKERFGLYYVGVFLLDQSGTLAVLKAGTGEAGLAMLQAGHKLTVSGTSMIGWAISRRQPRIALDTGQDAVRFDNPHLPETRSELALPMTSGTQVLGALTIQSNQPAAFDENDILALQGVADSLAIAIENARLFQQTESNLREIRTLQQQYLKEAWEGMLASQGEIHYTYHNPAQISTGNGNPETIKKPIAIRDQVIGNLILEIDQPDWEPEDDAFVEAVISEAAVALENMRLLEANQLSSQHDRILANVSGHAWASTDIDQILKTTLQELVQALQASNGMIFLEIPGEQTGN